MNEKMMEEITKEDKLLLKTWLSFLLNNYDPKAVEWEIDGEEKEFLKTNGLQWTIEDSKEKKYIRTTIQNERNRNQNELDVLRKELSDLSDKKENIRNFLEERIKLKESNNLFFDLLSRLVFDKNLSEIALLKAELEGDPKGWIEASIRSSENESKKYESMRNENNVNFEYVIKFPDGTASAYESTVYPADFEGMNEEFQLKTGQNEQFKIKMEIEITDSKRTNADYEDLFRYFASRPPLRTIPLKNDMIRVIKSQTASIKEYTDIKNKETLAHISRENEKTCVEFEKGLEKAGVQIAESEKRASMTQEEVLEKLLTRSSEMCSAIGITKKTDQIKLSRFGYQYLNIESPNYGNLKASARAAGIPETTARRWRDRLKDKYGLEAKKRTKKDYEEEMMAEYNEQVRYGKKPKYRGE